MALAHPSPFLTCTILICISGCTSLKQERPTDWPDVVITNHECPDISGTYINQSERGEPSLFHELTGTERSGLSTWELGEISIQWIDESRQTLRLIIDDKRSGEYEPIVELLRKSKGDFSCENGQLLIAYREKSDLGLVGGVTSGTRRFEQAVDGSLLREDRYDVVAQFLAVPSVSSDNRAYYRWPQVSGTAKHDE